MKAPRARETAIDTRRIRLWLRDFGAFRHNLNQQNIRDWLDQFDAAHQDVAARILDCVDFYSLAKVATAFREILDGLPGWDKDPKKRKGTWRFCAYSSSAGESGDVMLSRFRHANGLSAKKYDEFFIYRSDILLQKLGDDDTLVMIDDFVGTGKQVCDTWDRHISELVSGIGNVYLVVVAAVDKAVKRVRDETGLSLIAHTQLGLHDNLWADECGHFTAEEKQSLLTYCTTADQNTPKGYGECGLVVVFSDSCPNNSLPILHRVHNRWEGLFPRYE
jgi:hypothetical protein